ncbi:peptide chain release factor N(5)-glutamine methyltransferase [Propionivibrio sp.]|uniref:peptide chain release factor N(5)-glutamine methyltransferase n=1 Tax=Propionivibrio sp. TaxID=2212460 RepID=UPI00272E6C97|nr:peptide chain release factor N(5)-glutamine methyltransferase [Propionivibrio sp.]
MIPAVGASLGEAWRLASRRIDRLDARLLLEHVCGCRHADLIAHPERPLSAAQAAEFEALVARRAGGEPLAYLVGSVWFGDLAFRVTPAVLIPRPDTEVLVELAVERAQAFASPRIVDLGTGSGIVAISLARRCPDAQVTATDVSAAALDVARANAIRHGAAVRFVEGDWFVPLGDERFDLVVSNPPYVVEGDPHLQLNGLPFEPRGALTDGIAGGDGLACIRRIVASAPAHLRAGGWLLMEHGYDQAVEVRGLLVAAGFLAVDSWRDNAGIERVSGGRWPGA